MIRTVALLAALLLLAVPGRAQVSPLTLDEALELAREHNPDLARAGYVVEGARASEIRGWGRFLPEVGANASMGRFSSTTMTARNEFGQPVALDDAASYSVASASGRVAAQLTLFDGLRRVNQLQAARAGSREALAGRERAAVRVDAEVRRRFYDALGVARLVEVEERLLRAARTRLEATRAMVDAGAAAPRDVLGAEVDLARQEMALEDARAEAENTRLLLLETIGAGLENAAAVEIAGEFPDPLGTDSLDEAALVDLALRSSPRLRAARAAALEAEHTSDAARATRWPSVQLSASFDRGISLPDAGQLTSYPWNRGLGLGLSASFPIFTGFSMSAEIAQARATEKIARAELRSARLAVEREVRSAVTNVEGAERAVRLAERTAELSRRRLDMGQEGFRRGMIGFTELQQLIDRAALAERTVVRARMAYARALAALSEAVGQEADGGL